MIYNAGTKENSGIFSQSQGWIILAEALRGHGERAFTYFMENAPAAQNDRAEVRKLEPYFPKKLQARHLTVFYDIYITISVCSLSSSAGI